MPMLCISSDRLPKHKGIRIAPWSECKVYGQYERREVNQNP